MPRQPKYPDVIRVIEQRIRHGDYLLDSMPGERAIASETGVSHMTARKAVQVLIERGVLCRDEQGALMVEPGYSEGRQVAQIVLLRPSYPSPFLGHLQQSAAIAAQAAGLDLRAVHYGHWDDPIVREDTFRRNALIIPISTDVPRRVIDWMRRGQCVSLDIDLSQHGIPSVQLFPDHHVEAVFDHLYRLGHRTVHLLSTHCDNEEIERRVQIWKAWRTRQGVDGELWERPAASFEDPTPAGRLEMLERIDKGGIDGHAVIGTTCPAAIGAIRACWERRFEVGRRVSVGTINIEPPATFMAPSITGLDMPDIAHPLQQAIDWFQRGGPWDGPVRLVPPEPKLHLGESCGPAPLGP